MKPKLCYYLPEFNLATDTHYRYLYELINDLSESFDITLIIEKNRSDTRYFRKQIKVHPIFGLSVFTTMLLAIIAIIKARLSGCNKFYIHYSHIGAICSSLVTKLLGGRVWYWNCGMMWIYQKDYLSQFLLKITLHLVDYLVTGSKTLANGYSTNYGIDPDRIKVIPNWVDISRFNHQITTGLNLRSYIPNKSYKVIIFVHRLAERKGADLLPEIFKNIHSQVPKVKLTVAGEGPCYRQLQEIISNENLSDLILLGGVSNNDIPQLMRSADLFILPSREEGFPRVLTECLASGLPYVTTDVGSVRDITPKPLASYISRQEDINDFCAKCVKLLKQTDKTLIEFLKKDALKYDKKYAINNFKSLLNEKN